MAAAPPCSLICYVQSGTACDRPETAKLITLSPTPENVWQQLPEKSMDNFMLINTKDIATPTTTQTANTPEPAHSNDVQLRRL